MKRWPYLAMVAAVILAAYGATFLLPSQSGLFHALTNFLLGTMTVVLFILLSALVIGGTNVFGYLGYRVVCKVDDQNEPQEELSLGQHFLMALVLGILGGVVQLILVHFLLPNWPLYPLWNIFGWADAAKESASIWWALFGLVSTMLGYARWWRVFGS